MCSVAAVRCPNCLSCKKKVGGRLHQVCGDVSADDASSNSPPSCIAEQDRRLLGCVATLADASYDALYLALSHISYAEDEDGGSNEA